MLSCKDLCLVYPDGNKTKTVLDKFNLEIKKGENIILLGPSGSGKSSLIYLLSCVKQPTSGDIFFNERRLTSMSQNALCDLRKKKFSFIFQMHFLIPYLTVIENVLTGINDYSPQSRRKVSELLEKLGLGGYENKKLYQMSGGERQRTAVARALISEPEIIFADEPTASLDHDTALEVMHLLKNLNKNCTLVMATHDTSILSGDERIVEVNKK